MVQLSHNTLEQERPLGFALVVDRPMREKGLLLPLYLRHRRRDYSRMLVSHMRFNYISGYVLMHIRHLR